MKRALFVILALLWSLSATAAPVVVIPGDSASYMYFPEGSAAPSSGPSNSTSEPVGFIGIFPKTPPSGWLPCDGSVIQAADYPDLVLFLTGNPSATSAVLPDMRAAFLRGWDHGRGVDSGRALKTIQAGQNLSHAHTAASVSTAGAHTHALSIGGVGDHVHSLTGTQFVDKRYDSNHMDRTGPSYLTNNPVTSVDGAHAHSISGISTAGAHTHAMSVGANGGTEARPRNVAVVFAMKAAK